MVRSILLVALSSLHAAPGAKGPSLKPGDPAPPLKVSRWLRGDEVRKFEPGKVYVVEFWATWCGPCIAFMPHLAELQAEYRDRGVTIIGFTSRDPNNTEEQAAAFVKKRGGTLKYTFAYAGDQATWDAWMKAAGREGIPCSFVVDRAGRIAYVGHPMYLPLALPKVVAGDATARAVGAEMARVQAEFADVSAALSRDPEAGLRALKAFEARHPPLADFLPAVRAKLSYFPEHGRPGEAKAYAEALVAKAARKGDALTLGLASAILRRGDGKSSKELLAVAVKAAEAEVLLDGGRDARALLNLADAYSARGDRARAKEYARRAVGALREEAPALKEFIEKEARRLGAER